jgi:hypothetical protein
MQTFQPDFVSAPRTALISRPKSPSSGTRTGQPARATMALCSHLRIFCSAASTYGTRPTHLHASTIFKCGLHFHAGRYDRILRIFEDIACVLPRGSIVEVLRQGPLFTAARFYPAETFS